MTASCSARAEDDCVSVAVMTEEILDLSEVQITIGYRDVAPELFKRFRTLFVQVWDLLPELDRKIIAAGLRWSQHVLPIGHLRPGIWLLPSVRGNASYVWIGMMVFDAFDLEKSADLGYRFLIRHELAHVWQESTHMRSGLLTDEHMETHADWMAGHRMIRAGWWPIDPAAPTPAPGSSEALPGSDRNATIGGYDVG